MLLEAVKHKNSRSLSQLLTVMDRLGPKVLSHPDLLETSSFSFRIGVTGPPGAGKSTLIDGLIREFRKRKKTVAVLAVDPSSPFSKGAILGDRIRYNTYFNDPGVYVRSIGSRGSLGGLSASSYLMLRAFDLYGFDVVLVETVGVGQTELEIMNVADYVAVVLVPESGDGIQTMKAGLLEIADLFIINKSDRAGAESLKRELENSIAMGESDHEIEVLLTAAVENRGVEELANRLLFARDAHDWKLKRKAPWRIQAEAAALLRWTLEKKISAQTQAITSPRAFRKWVLTL